MNPDKKVEVQENTSQPRVEKKILVSQQNKPERLVLDFIEKSSEKLKRLAKQEAVLHDRLWPSLRKEHETVRQLQELVNYILVQVNLPVNFLKAKVFDSDYPDAHVQVFAKTIRVSRDFLETLEGNSKEILAVLGHEIGHVLLSHYKINLSNDSDNAYDPLDEHVQRYEHEYQADKASTIITNRLGIKPDTLAEALKKLEQKIQKRFKEGQKNKRNLTYVDPQRYYQWVLLTHPNTTRRIFSILRDAEALPKYPPKFVFQPLLIPSNNDFPRQNPVFSLYNDALHSYPDCLWEEKEFPSDVPTDEKKLEDFFVGEVNPPLSFTPESVEKLLREGEEEVSKWWQEALNQITDQESYEDLRDDINQYSLKVTKKILTYASPELNFEAETDENGGHIVNTDEYFDKEMKKESVLHVREGFRSHAQIMIVTSLLIRNWFDKDSTIQTTEGMQGVCDFLGSFFEFHGEYLPYTGSLFFIKIENLFTAANDDEERAKIASLWQIYERELTGDLEIAWKLAKSLMPQLKQWFEVHGSKDLYRSERYATKKIEKDQLPKAMMEAADTDATTPAAAKDFLRGVPLHFYPQNLTFTALSFAQETNRSIDEEGYPDHYIDAKPELAIGAMDEEEFVERYFGSRRNDYEKAKYEFLDNKIAEFKAIEKLWLLAGYENELKSMENGLTKVLFIFETFRARSAKCDQLIIEALGWEKIEYVEDVIKAQDKILEETDVEILFSLSDHFFNPILNLAVSQSLWQIYQKDREGFWSKVPLDEKVRVLKDIEQVPGTTHDPELLAVLVCYKSPSYLRDDLLRPIVDAAPNQASTLAVASWYSEPPPGILRPRTSETLIVTETLLDAMRDMSRLDKQELFLYFLGHRFFCSGFDISFFPKLKHRIGRYRHDAIRLGEKEFREKYDFAKKVDDDEFDLMGKDNNFSRTEKILSVDYLVDEPDSLVILTKASGIPVDVLLKEQRLATTKREQRDFITYLLYGPNGLLLDKNKDAFLKCVARDVVLYSAWGEKSETENKEAMVDLLAFAMNHCPERRMPDLFLSLWNLQQDQHTLPRVVATLLQGMGCLFIKSGQYLGTQSTSLPLEWIQAFRGLSDQNARSEKTLLYEQEHAIYAEESPFSRIGKKFGEGSMAAVYEGELKNMDEEKNRKVAIKVFHSNLEVELEEDVSFLDKLVGFINSKNTAFRIRLPSNLAEVSRNQILAELSYEGIQKNYEDMQKILERSPSIVSFKTAAIKSESSREKFIAYEFSEGKPLDKIDETNRTFIEGEIGLELLRQILVEGVYQADPNIGNFKILKPSNPQERIEVHWLDLDHVGRFTQQETEELRNLIKELFIDKDSDKIATYLVEYIQATSLDLKELKNRIKTWLDKNQILTSYAITTLEETFITFLDFLAEEKLLLKEHYVTLLRALGLMRPYLSNIPPEKLIEFLKII